MDLEVGQAVCDGVAPRDRDAEAVLDPVMVWVMVIVGEFVIRAVTVVVVVTLGVTVIVLEGVLERVWVGDPVEEDVIVGLCVPETLDV